MVKLSCFNEEDLARKLEGFGLVMGQLYEGKFNSIDSDVETLLIVPLRCSQCIPMERTTSIGWAVVDTYFVEALMPDGHTTVLLLDEAHTRKLKKMC